MADRKADIVIVGGGISGAALLHRLAQEGCDVVLLERADRLGGVIRSQKTSTGVLAEFGPNTIQLNAALNRLIDELELEDELLLANRAARNRYIVRRGHLVPVRISPLSFLRSPLLSFFAKLRLLREPFVGRAPENIEESLAQFVERRLGTQVLDYLIGPFITGIYAGDPEQLSARYAFRRLYELEQEHGSLFRGVISGIRSRRKNSSQQQPKQRSGLFTFRNGLQTLPDAIGSRWAKNVRTGVDVSSVQRAENGWEIIGSGETYHADQLVIATEAYATATLLQGCDPGVADALRRIAYPPVTIVLSVYNRDDVAHSLDGFGMLVPDVEKRGILGTIFFSTLFPDRVPEGCAVFATFVGGALHPDRALESDQALATNVHNELADLLGITSSPRSCDHHLWKQAIPQYTIGYGSILNEIVRAEHEHPGLHLLGNYRSGVGFGDCVAAAGKVFEVLSVEC